jgi:hypothetical protein
MFSYTKQNIEARESLVNHQMPYYMDKVMECIMRRANDCEYTCAFELRPEKGEDMEFFDLIISAVRRKLKSLGYSVTNNQTRFGIKVSWASNSNDPQNY